MIEIFPMTVRIRVLSGRIAVGLYPPREIPLHWGALHPVDPQDYALYIIGEAESGLDAVLSRPSCTDADLRARWRAGD